MSAKLQASTRISIASPLITLRCVPRAWLPIKPTEPRSIATGRYKPRMTKTSRLCAYTAQEWALGELRVEVMVEKTLNSPVALRPRGGQRATPSVKIPPSRFPHQANEKRGTAAAMRNEPSKIKNVDLTLAAFRPGISRSYDLCGYSLTRLRAQSSGSHQATLEPTLPLRHSRCTQCEFMPG